MAPTPKPPGQRRRRNAGQTQWTELPGDGRRGDVPVLPGENWLESTLEWWETIWRSPMATVWQDADIDALVRLARLRDEFRRGDLPVSALGAVQQLEDRFGLSPKARRQLQWEVGHAEGSEPAREQPPKPKRLRAVDAA